MLGETAIQKNGSSATVISHNENNTVDIQFQDGTIVKNQSYVKFKTGQIHYPIRDYTGLSGTDKYGNHFTV